ncbi:hypothetical protein Bca101_043531 [Brassica carinata]
MSCSTTHTAVTSPMGKDDPHRGHLAHGRGPSRLETVHPRLSSLNSTLSICYDLSLRINLFPIAKALGKRLNIDAPNARLQVSIDADRPLQFERRVGFPNGVIGKVLLEYEGLSRHCFGCRRITHDIYSCPELTQEERDQKIKEFWELNKTDALPQQFKNRATPSIRSNNTNNKRPRSPSDDGLKRSPGRSQYPGHSREEKRRKESAIYWSSRNHVEYRESTRHAVRIRDDSHDRISLRNATVCNRLETRPEKRSREIYVSQKKNQGRAREYTKERSHDRHHALYSQHSQRVWRLRSQVTDSRSNNQSRSAAFSGNQVLGSRDGIDSQRTISEVPPETWDLPGENSHVSRKGSPTGLLTRDRGVIRIRDGEAPPRIEETRYVPPLARSSSEPEVDNLELDNLMASKHIDDMVMNKEDEAVVDKLVEDFGGVVMDDEMMQNDDLLVDEPGFDAEKIEAISQLSPVNAERKDERRKAYQRAQENDLIARASNHVETNSDADKEKQLDDAQSLDRKGRNKNNSVGGTPNRKRHPCIPVVKGARASKKLNLPKGRPSSKLPKAQASMDRTNRHKPPRPPARTARAEVTSSTGEDDPHRGRLTHGRRWPVLRSPRPRSRTVRAEVASPTGEDGLHRGCLAHRRG